MIESQQVTALEILTKKSAAARGLVTVEPAHTARQALNLMSTYNVSQLPVVDTGDCVGSVSEGTLMADAIANPGVLDRPVHDIMESPYPVVDPDFPLDGFSELLSREVPAVLVRHQDELAGIVTRYDLLHEMAGIS
jgi:cystathionine beta-synthase